MSRVLVTGSSGFLGRAVVRALEVDGREVVGIDAATGGDVTDQRAFNETLTRCRPHAVVHLAAVLTPACADDPVFAAWVNCVGSAVVMNGSLAAGVGTVVYGSSVAAIAPRSVYGVTKAFAEQLAVPLHEAHPTSRLIGIRFGWIYGEGRVRGWNDVMDVINGFALERDAVRYPDYKDALDWTYIDDAAAAIVACLDRAQPGATVYDLAGDRRQISDAVVHLQRSFPGTGATPDRAATPPTQWSALDPRRLLDEIGFRCSVSMEEGLDRTVDAIRDAAGLAPIYRENVDD